MMSESTKSTFETLIDNAARTAVAGSSTAALADADVAALMERVARDAASAALEAAGVPRTRVAPTSPSADDVAAGRTVLVTVTRSLVEKRVDTYVMAVSPDVAETLMDFDAESEDVARFDADLMARGVFTDTVTTEADESELTLDVAADMGGRSLDMTHYLG